MRIEMTTEKPKPEVWALPNLLSLSRIVLTPVFLWVMSLRRPWTAFAVFLVAGMTDALDGFAARKLRLKTTLGIWLDPLGDKVLLTATFIALTIRAWSAPNTLPFWLTAVCIGRDVLIASGAAVVLSVRGRTVFPPTLLGKAVTISQVFALLAVLFLNGQGLAPAWLPWLYRFVAILTCLSGIQYTAIGISLLRGKTRPGGG
jgi:cardiolipin synthase